MDSTMKMSNGAELSERRHRRSHQSVDGRLCLESETTATGYFLPVFTLAGTVGCVNPLMEKDQIA